MTTTRTLSKASIEALLAMIEKGSFVGTFRRCKVTESTFRRAINGKSLNESSWKAITTIAKGGKLPGE
jgi:hypothetical protein